MFKRLTFLRTSIAAAVATTAGLAAAQAAEPIAQEEPWRFQVTPYVWLLGMDARMDDRPYFQNAKISQSFSDIWDNLNTAAFLNGTARKGPYVLQADSSYASLSDTATLPLSSSLNAKVSAKVKQTSFTLTGGYNWAITPSDSVDLMAGFRWWHLKGSLDAKELAQKAHLKKSEVRLNKSFADPIVAVRWRHDFNDRWSSLLYADYGTFSGGSQSTYQGLAVLNYRVGDNIYISAGYRTLDVDYRDNGKRLDVRLSGPVLGATFRF